MKRALITGVTGQTGSYLAEYLLSLGYDVSGMVRRSSSPNLSRIESLLDLTHFRIVEGDMTDAGSLHRLMQSVQPHEVYNLAAQSFVKRSFDEPVLTSDVDALGVARILEAVRQTDPEISFYQASSSEMFGRVVESPQSETTPFRPRSPYGVAKVYGHHLTVNYRESYGLFAVSGICFNHESPRRGDEFVTRKITRAVARIKEGRQERLKLGNLDARRDWGYAGDYVRAMHLLLQAEEPEDAVIATGCSYTVRDFAAAAFSAVNLYWQKYVDIEEAFYRPAEVDELRGDPSKIESMGWRREVEFLELVEMMVRADLTE
jgi:GDPmannose 4,6-dehydratase